jgi:hypothetical protein
MAITHTNRKGDTYYLHKGQTRAGKPTYFFSRKQEGDLADAVPDGYEVYEKPRGQVFLRKVVPTRILPLEVATVEAGIRRAGIHVFCTDVEKDSIVVYMQESAMMRFILHDAETRLFEVQRWCFRGSVDNWSYPLAFGDLSTLVAKYVRHLDKESFFDLM